MESAKPQEQVSAQEAPATTTAATGDAAKLQAEEYKDLGEYVT